MADSNVPITAGSGTLVDSRTNTAGEHRQVMVLGDGAAISDNVAAFRPDAVLRIAMDPTTLLWDAFEVLDTVNVWTLGGTVVPTQVAGALTVSAGTAASAQSTIRSQPAFTNASNAFLVYASAFVLEAGVVTGNKRCWGLGTLPGTSTTAVPIANGAVFEIQDTDGALVGAVYSNSVRTSTVALTRPADGGAHRYSIYFRASRVYFELDNVTVGSINFPNPVVDSLPVVAVSVNAAAGAPGTAAQLIASVVTAGDSARSATQLADGIFPWREARIDANGQLATFGPDVVATGTITATDSVLGVHAGAGIMLTGTPTAGSYVVLPVGGGESGSLAQLTGAFGGGTVWFECSASSTNGIDGLWTTLSCRTLGTTGSTVNDSTTTAGLYRGNCSGMTFLRIRVTGATAPSIGVILRGSEGPGPLALNAPIPAGTQAIGTVGINPATSGTLVASVGGNAAGQTPPGTGGTGVVALTMTGAVTAGTSLVAAPGAGLSIYVTDMEGSNSGSTGTLLSLYEGASSANPRYNRFVAAGGGGFVTNLKTPWKLPANTAVGYGNTASSTSIYLTLNYFVAP